jgi:DNA-binding SARP family transcriptional activator
MGLLLYVALEGRGRPVERDLLASMLWPDTPLAHARGSFRTALSQIRKSLGPAAIEADAQQVTLRLADVHCDALALLDEVAAAEWEKGAELAAGPLAPGFHVGDLGEFDRWLDVQREWVRRAATLTLRTAAEGCAERDPDRAERFLARAALHSPFDEAILTQRLRLLAARGDRTGASSLFQAWNAELRSEMDMAPSAEVDALYRGIIASDTAPSAPDAVGASPPPVADRPGGDPPSEDQPSIRAALTSEHAALASAPETQAPAPPPSLAGAHLHPPETAGPLAGTRYRLGLRTPGALVLVTATLALAWGGWNVLAVGPATRGVEGASRAGATAPPAPPTMAVLALVDSGMVHYRAGDYGGAVATFLAATEADPDYPRAQYGLALAGTAAGRADLYAGAAAALAILRPFMGGNEALRVDALLARPDEARAIYAALIAAEPDSLDVLLQYAELAFHWGSFWGIPRSDVQQAFETLAGAFAPRTANAHLIRMEAADGDLAGARARLRAMEEGGATPLDLLVGRTLVAVLDPSRSPPVSEVASGTAAEISLVVGAAAALTVEPDAVDDFLARMFDAVEEPMRLDLAIWNALAAVSRGRMARAEAWLDRAEQSSPARADEFRAVIATLPWLPPDVARWNTVAARLSRWRTGRLVGPYWDDLASDAIYAPRRVFLAYMTQLPASGDDESFAAFDSLAQRTGLDLALEAAYRDILRARSALVANNLAEAALDALGEPKVAPDLVYPSLLHHPFAAGRFLYTRALVNAGRPEAHDWLRSWPDASGYDRAYLPELLSLRADVAANQGEREEAARYYARAAALLEGCDAIFLPKKRHLERRLEELRRR